MPDAILPEMLNLAARYLDTGVPPGQKAENGHKYTATVIFENTTDVDPGGPVRVYAYHSDYRAILKDANGNALPTYSTPDGNQVQTIMLPPHSKMMLYFDWTADSALDYPTAKLCATINLSKEELEGLKEAGVE